MGLLSETNYRYEQQDIENDIDILDNSPEMKGVEILLKEIDKVKTRTVKGIDKVLDIAATTRGVTAGASLLTIYAPQVAGGASFANYLITGKSYYGKRALSELVTLGIGIKLSNTIKVGKILNTENVLYFRNTFGGTYGTFTYGISLGAGL